MFEKIERIVLNQQDGDSGKENEGQERGIQFVISGGNSAEPLDFLEEALDQSAAPYTDTSLPAKD